MKAVRVRYCSCCGWPVHYCRYRKHAKLQMLGCAAALKKEDEALWAFIYSQSAAFQDEVEQSGDSSPAVKEPVESNESIGEESDEEDSDEEEDVNPDPNNCLAYDKTKVLPFGVPIKPHIKNQPNYVPILQIRFAKRGMNKGVTQVFNYEDFPVSVPEVMATMRKRLACAVSETVLDQLGGEVITVQGNYKKEVESIFVAAGVPRANIFHAASGKNTKRKRK